MKGRRLDLSRVTCNKNKSWGKAALQVYLQLSMVVYVVKISENYGLHSAERGKKKQFAISCIF